MCFKNNRQLLLLLHVLILISCAAPLTTRPPTTTLLPPLSTITPYFLFFQLPKLLDILAQVFLVALLVLFDLIKVAILLEHFLKQFCIWKYRLLVPQEVPYVLQVPPVRVGSILGEIEQD